jgi:hypothetical protein
VFAVVEEILSVVAPVDHEYVEYPVPASRVAELPEHIDVGPVITGLGLVPELSVVLAVPVHPKESVTVTIHVLGPVGAIVSVEAPVFQ